MKLSLYFIVLILSLTSCQKDDDIDCEYEIRRLNHEHIEYVNEQQMLFMNNMIDRQTFVYRINAHLNFVEQSINNLGCNH